MWRLIPQYIPHIRCACVSHGALAVWPTWLLRYCNGQASEAQRGSKASSRLPSSVSGLVTLPRRVAATLDGIQQTCRLRNRAVTRPVARSPGRTPTVRRLVSRPHATSRSPCRTAPPPAAPVVTSRAGSAYRQSRPHHLRLEPRGLKPSFRMKPQRQDRVLEGTEQMGPPRRHAVALQTAWQAGGERLCGELQRAAA